MKKQYKSSILKNNKITQKKFLNSVPLMLRSLLSYFLDFAPGKKKSIVGISND